jgi:hypothetical protein
MHTTHLVGSYLHLGSLAYLGEQKGVMDLPVGPGLLERAVQFIAM